MLIWVLPFLRPLIHTPSIPCHWVLILLVRLYASLVNGSRQAICAVWLACIVWRLWSVGSECDVCMREKSQLTPGVISNSIRVSEVVISIPCHWFESCSEWTLAVDLFDRFLLTARLLYLFVPSIMGSMINLSYWPKQCCTIYLCVCVCVRVVVGACACVRACVRTCVYVSVSVPFLCLSLSVFLSIRSPSPLPPLSLSPCLPSSLSPSLSLLQTMSHPITYSGRSR